MEHLAHALVIDSGVGALSIIEEIRTSLPHISLSYASDNGFFPYGEKDADELIARVLKLVTALTEKIHPDIIVIACNTASTIALPEVRKHFDIPVVGVVPAIKPAALESQTKIIGLVATPGTVNRSYTDQLIAEYAENCTIIKVGSTRLVELAEDKLRGKKIAISDVSTALSPLFAHKDFMSVDTIVLACTHFPLIKEELVAAVQANKGNPEIRWLDSGKAIANRVDYLLRQRSGSESANAKLLNDTKLADQDIDNSSQQLQSFFTQPSPTIEALYPELERRLSKQIHFITVPDTIPNPIDSSLSNS